MRRFTIIALLLVASAALSLRADQPAVRVTILSDAFGRDPALHQDWGFSALVEAGGKRILFDTGNDSDHLAANVRRLEVDLSRLDFAVISHRHGDHTDGLRHLLKVNPAVTIYVPPDEYFGGPTPQAFFRNAEPSLSRHMRYFNGAVKAVVPHGTPWKGARFTIVPEAREVAPGVRLVVNRSPGPAFTETPELSLVIDTDAGAVVIVGCSHPGIERILASAGGKTIPLRLVVGGLHLVTTPREEVDRLADALSTEWKLGAIAPGHCTGEHAFSSLSRVFDTRYRYAGVGTVLVMP